VRIVNHNLPVISCCKLQIRIWIVQGTGLIVRDRGFVGEIRVSSQINIIERTGHRGRSVPTQPTRRIDMQSFVRRIGICSYIRPHDRFNFPFRQGLIVETDLVDSAVPAAISTVRTIADKHRPAVVTVLTCRNTGCPNIGKVAIQINLQRRPRRINSREMNPLIQR